MRKVQYLWALPALFLISVFVGALGGNTVNYQCKYIDNITPIVQDHGKYDTALYTIKYSDGTTGATSDIDNDGPRGAHSGTTCKTVFNYGFPYKSTNHNVVDESQVKAK